MFTSNKRVIRDGYLVAFEGEVMSDEEAAKRGLLEEEKPKPKATLSKAKPKPEPADDDYEEDEEEA